MQTRARHITFTNQYGYSRFPFGECLMEISDQLDENRLPDRFMIMNAQGDPRPEFLPYRANTTEPFAPCFVRRDRFTGVPSAETRAYIKTHEVPVLELHESGETRVYYPTSYRTHEPYTGRVYEMYYSDCYNLVQNWYEDVQRIKLPLGTIEEARSWAAELGRDFMEMALREQGFEPVARMREGDLLVIQSLGHSAHLGIVLDNNKLLHHPAERLSCIAHDANAWRKRARTILRHRSLM